MGLFDALGSVVKATVNTALLPVEVVRDVATGSMFDRNTKTGKRIDKIERNLDKVESEVDKALDD